MLLSKNIALVISLLLSFCSAGYGNSHLHFIREPQSALVNGNEPRVVFRCEASPPGTEIRWLHNGHSVHQNKWLKVSGQKLTILLSKMDNASKEHHLERRDMSLQCEIRFKGKVLVSAPAKLLLAILKPFAPETDLHVTAISGSTAVIPCDPPHSVPPVVTEFLFNSTMIVKSQDTKHLMASGDLQIHNVKPEDSGEYICVANNPFLKEKVTSKRKVILHVDEPSVDSPPSFTKLPRSNVSAALGRNITLECAASGYPIPVVTWTKTHDSLPVGRAQQVGGNLHLISVMQGDEGAYVCEAKNSLGSVETQSYLEEIQETPHILKSLKNVNLEAGANLTLNCQVRGHPRPILKWLHNGKELTWDGKKSHMTIPNVNIKHGGMYQCFASNVLGTTYVSATVTVTSVNNSKQSDDYEDYDDVYGTPFPYSERDLVHGDGEDGLRRHHDMDDILEPKHYGKKRKHKKKHSKGVKLIPPSKPEISRLSNTSVMVRWSVGQGGLPIHFFKVQYKEVGRRKSDWMTIDEDIASHIHSYAVTNLRTGGAYRFRIAAVYSNQDNKAGPISVKFILYKDPPMEKPFNRPEITFAEAVSPSAITLHWEYNDVESVTIEGFFIHYRATHTAGKYLKVTVLGSNTRSHIISHLLPNTGYDVKMQCFNIAGTSDFSNIFTSKTKASDSSGGKGNRNDKFDDDDTIDMSMTEPVSSKDSEFLTMLFIVLGTVLGLAAVFTSCVLFLIRRQKRNPRPDQDEEPNQENHARIGNGHVSSNGYIPVSRKINISVNPLSHLDMDTSEKLEELEDIVSNNNEIIRLQTFSMSQGPQEQPLLSDSERQPNANESKTPAVITSNIAESSMNSPTEL